MQIDYSLFPPINASLNATSAVLLFTGWNFIKRGHKNAHRACMVSAFIVSSVFLACYVTYHLHAGNVRFAGQGWIRPVYFTILITHTILAIAVVPLVLVTLFRAIKERFEAHKLIARWAYPIWMYVSVTGVLIYFFVYRWYAPHV